MLLLRPGDVSNWVMQAELVSYFSELVHWGAGLLLTIEGASATCAGWQTD